MGDEDGVVDCSYSCMCGDRLTTLDCWINGTITKSAAVLSAKYMVGGQVARQHTIGQMIKC